jgi:hypothetical protein
MTELRIGDQLIRYDREATIAAYSQVEQGGAGRCSCSGCRNFARLRDKIYPDAFRELLDKLGISPKKEGEAVHYGPKGDLHLYGGWFYFVGEVIEAGEGSSKAGDDFQYWTGTSFPRPPAAFGKTVAALEFMTQLPWVLEEPYDPAAARKAVKAKQIIDPYPNTLPSLADPER